MTLQQLPHNGERKSHLHSSLPVPEMGRHIRVAVPDRRLRHVLVAVVVVHEGRYLLDALWEHRVELGPDAAQANLQGAPQVRVRPHADPLEGAVAQVVPMNPVLLWYA